MDQKKCARCEVVKEVKGNFYPHKYTKDGYAHLCRECQMKENDEKRQRAKKQDELAWKRLREMKQEWEK
jgi:hypothetical protein